MNTVQKTLTNQTRKMDELCKQLLGQEQQHKAGLPLCVYSKKLSTYCFFVIGLVCVVYPKICLKRAKKVRVFFFIFLNTEKSFTVDITNNDIVTKKN